MRLTTLGLLVLVAVGASASGAAAQRSDEKVASGSQKTQVATFGGGCFWCVEPPFDKLAGVISTTSGYTGGTLSNPTYEQVSAGETGHVEVVQVVYDPAKVTYEKLLDTYWHNVDPLTPDRQFCDAGSQYRSAIFYHNEEQRRAAEASLLALKQARKFTEPIVTQLIAASAFYAAEEYHQDYYLKNPVRYKYYRFRCGRDKRLEQLWGAADVGDPGTNGAMAARLP